MTVKLHTAVWDKIGIKKIWNLMQKKCKHNKTNELKEWDHRLYQR